MGEALQYIPWIHNLTTFRQLIQTDLENNNRKIFQTIVLKRNLYYRYYVKGETVLKLIDKNYERQLLSLKNQRRKRS